MTKIEFFLARRYLASRRGHGLSVITWIALAGVIVGVMSLVTVLAVMSGFEKELKTKILGNNAHILVQVSEEAELSRSLVDDLLKQIRANPKIDSAMPVVYGEAFILSPRGGAEGVFVKGVDPSLVQRVLDLKNYVQEGAWDKFHDRSVILGESLASDLRISTGDWFTLVLNKGDFSPLGLTPRMQRLQVVDTFHSGMTQYDSRHAYIPLNLAETLFETLPKSIEVRAKDVRDISYLRDQLATTLNASVRVHDWLSLNKDFLSALRLEKTVMAVILGLIVLVAAFNITGSLIMIVRDKTRDIAILKSMGAFDQTILKIFFFQGAFVGIVGTIIGSLLGVVLSFVLQNYVQFPLDKEVYMIDTLPVDLRLSDVGLVALGALLITGIATLYPARLAASVIPTEGLKADG